MTASVYELHAANAASRLDQLVGYAGASAAAAPDGRQRRVSHRGGPAAPARCRVAMSSADVEHGGHRDAAGADRSTRRCSTARSNAWRDPEAALRSSSDALSAGGVVMVIAPTIDSRTARLFRSAWWEFNSANLHYFSADTLQSLLLKSGYGDPIIDADDSAVSLEYFRAKIPAVSSAFYRRSLRLLVLGDTAVSAAPRVSLAEQPTRHSRSREADRGRSRRCRSSFRPTTRRRRSRRSWIACWPSRSTASTSRSCWSRATPRTARARMRVRYGDASARAADSAGSAARQGQRRPGRARRLHRRRRAVSGRRSRVRRRRLRRSHRAAAGVPPELRHRFAPLSKGRVWKIRQFNDATPLATVFNLGHVFFLGLFNFLYRQRLRDPFSMFKVFRRECLYGLTFECNRFDFDFEIVIKLLRKGYRPLELPVNYRARSPSEGKKVTMLRDPLTWMRALLKFRWGPLYTDKR